MERAGVPHTEPALRFPNGAENSIVWRGHSPAREGSPIDVIPNTRQARVRNLLLASVGIATRKRTGRTGLQPRHEDQKIHGA